jgi:hypothetical protein
MRTTWSRLLPWRRRVLSLEQHPNLHEILNMLARLPHLTDREIARLAHGWRDNRFVAGARHRALSPNSPLVVEVLAAFDRVDAMFARDLAGLEGPYDPYDPKPHIVNTALKAIRDGLAAAYARPILRRGEYVALIGPWRRALPADEPVGSGPTLPADI